MELSTKLKCMLLLSILLNVLTETTTLKSNSSNTQDSKNTTNKPLENGDNVTSEYYYISTTKEPFEMCDFNSTCNTTGLINATDSELLISNFSEKIAIIRNFPTSEQFCTCDLQVSMVVNATVL